MQYFREKNLRLQCCCCQLENVLDFETEKTLIPSGFLCQSVCFLLLSSFTLRIGTTKDQPQMDPCDQCNDPTIAEIHLSDILGYKFGTLTMIYLSEPKCNIFIFNLIWRLRWVGWDTFLDLMTEKKKNDLGDLRHILSGKTVCQVQ